MKSVKRGWVVLGACVALWGCQTNQAKVTVLQAPEIGAASGYRSISVARFSGQQGDGMAVALESAMMNARVQQKPVYRSVTRAPEGRSLGTDTKALASAARSQGSDAIVVGEVTKATVQDQRSTTKETQCTRYEDSKKLIKKCLASREVTVQCIERKANLQVQVRLVDAKTSEAVFNGAIVKEDTSKACGQETPTDGAAMLGQLQAAVVSDIMNKIVPHEKEVSMSLMSADDRIQSASKERFAGALKFAESGRMDRACETLRDLYEAEKNSMALNYNLGVCAESERAYWRASELYRTADRLSTEPNKLINEALVRNDANITKAGTMAQKAPDLLRKDQTEAGAAPQTIAGGGKPQQVTFATPGRPQNITDDVLLLKRRTALVIGNGKYRHAGTLQNPVNDARSMAIELRKLGFEVVAVEDASLEKMNAAIDEFGRSIKEGGATLVFYAGHGVQVKGENYLLPVDANIKSESEVTAKAINLGQVLSKLEDAKSQVNLVILDACRNNPFARSWRSANNGGLAAIDAPTGTVVAFATAPGKTAADGSGSNGLFTSHLLQQLRVPNLRLEDVLKNTRKGVVAASRNEQTPWDSSSLTGDFYFSVSKN